MAKETKPKSKRTQVKDLSVPQQELTTDEASKVKGGLLLPAVQKVREAAARMQSTGTSGTQARQTTVIQDI